MRHTKLLGAGAFGPEPAPDPALGALLRDVVGDAPGHAVDWTALAARIGSRVGAQATTPWWSYAAQWERRMIPLALAAGIVASAALWNSTATPATTSIASASAFTTEVASGAPADDAASQFARTITNAVDLAVGVPE